MLAKNLGECVKILVEGRVGAAVLGFHAQLEAEIKQAGERQDAERDPLRKEFFRGTAVAFRHAAVLFCDFRV